MFKQTEKIDLFLMEILYTEKCSDLYLYFFSVNKVLERIQQQQKKNRQEKDEEEYN